MRSHLAGEQQRRGRLFARLLRRLSQHNVRLRLRYEEALAASAQSDAEVACRPIAYSIMTAALCIGTRRYLAVSRLQARGRGARARAEWRVRAAAARTIRAAMLAHHRLVRSYRAHRAAPQHRRQLALIAISAYGNVRGGTLVRRLGALRAESRAIRTAWRRRPRTEAGVDDAEVALLMERRRDANGLLFAHFAAHLSLRAKLARAVWRAWCGRRARRSARTARAVEHAVRRAAARRLQRALCMVTLRAMRDMAAAQIQRHVRGRAARTALGSAAAARAHNDSGAKALKMSGAPRAVFAVPGDPGAQGLSLIHI